MKTTLADLNELYRKLKELTFELSTKDCSDIDCTQCPFNCVETSDCDNPLRCGGIIDLFNYNKEEEEQVK